MNSMQILRMEHVAIALYQLRKREVPNLKLTLWQRTILITQYKKINQFDDEERKSINEIIFIKTDKHLVSTINVGILESPQIALMLVAKKYRPSLYYGLHIEDIEQILKKSI